MGLCMGEQFFEKIRDRRRRATGPIGFLVLFLSRDGCAESRGNLPLLRLGNAIEEGQREGAGTDGVRNRQKWRVLGAVFEPGRLLMNGGEVIRSGDGTLSKLGLNMCAVSVFG